jgi:hypothetical protein
LAFNRPAEAKVEFEATLKREPNRFHALYGAARASALAGDRAAATAHYQQLLKVCERAQGSPRAALNEARSFLASR